MTLAEELQWDRARLEADYTAKLTCSEERFRAIIADYARRSEAAQALPGGASSIAYDGARSAEVYDLYGTQPGERRPCFVFIHGGYWRALSRGHSAFMAPMLAAQGIATAVPDYTLAPAVGITEIQRQCRAMLAHLWHHAERLGLDRDRIVVGGSSAGGHLTAAVAAGGWQQAAGLPAQPLKGILPISGLFELAPLAGMHVNDWMQFTEVELADSPLRHLPAAPLPAVVALARQETPGFFRQSEAYAAALDAPVLVVEERNHFDVVLDLTDPETALSRALLSLF